jgi:hypothetical protein
MVKPRIFSQPWLRMVAQWGAPSMIASFQRGTILIAAAATSAVATITAVDPTRAVLVWCGTQVNGADSPDHGFARLELATSTQVNAIRAASGSNSVSVNYEVIEFVPGIIRSVQRGASVLGTPPVLTTITPVDLAKASASLQGYSCVYTIGDPAAVGLLPRIELFDATTLRSYNTGGGWVTLGWQVVETY